MTTLITGASSGIGEALALASAQEGATLFLCGRAHERLEKVTMRCRERGATVYEDVMDVANAEKMQLWIRRCNEIAPLDRVFANAGVSTGEESEENVRRTFAVNAGGVVNTVLPAIEVFSSRASLTSGQETASPFSKAARELRTKAQLPQIILTASIAGYGPLKACPSYSATKAFVKTWGLSLRGMLAPRGIRVSVVCPGFVRSRITDGNTCPMPFFMEADKAARIILDRVERNVGLIAFPWPMRFSVWMLSCLPARLTEFIASLLPAKIKRQGVVTDGKAK